MMSCLVSGVMSCSTMTQGPSLLSIDFYSCPWTNVSEWPMFHFLTHFKSFIISSKKSHDFINHMTFKITWHSDCFNFEVPSIVMMILTSPSFIFDNIVTSKLQVVHLTIMDNEWLMIWTDIFDSMINRSIQIIVICCL